MSRGMSSHTSALPRVIRRYRPYVCHIVQYIQVCSTQIDVVDHRRQRSLVMEMEVRGNSEAEPHGLTASTANVTCATRTPHPHMTRMHRLRTGARQRCACVFLVN